MFRKSHTPFVLCAIFLALFLAFMLPAVVLAQPDPGSLETTPGGNPVVTLPFFEEVVTTVLTVIGAAALGLFGNAPVTEPLVQALKWFFSKLPDVPLLRILKGAPANHVTMGVSLVLTVLAGIAAYFGLELDFANYLDMIKIIAGAIVALITTQAGANTVYDFVAKRNMPLIGWSRSPHQ